MTALPSTLGALPIALQPPNVSSDVSSDVPSDVEAIKRTADKFEALLLHSLMKAMRKTNLAESTPNGRAMYDDMLDQQFASIMSESGKLGISESIVRQLLPKNVSDNPLTENQLRLREVMFKDREMDQTTPMLTREPVFSTRPVAGLEVADIQRLRQASGLWNQEVQRPLRQREQAFIEPLIPHAEGTARRLGTSVNAVLAIAALETGWGQHVIVDEDDKQSNNLFGIKAQPGDEQVASSLTTEYIDGKPQKLRDDFRVFDSPAAAVEGFADFLLENPRYATALDYGHDPDRFMVELQKAGYATDPDYAAKAIKVMRDVARHLETSP